MPFADFMAQADAATLKHLGGVAVVYAPAVGDPVGITAHFDEQYQFIDGDAGVESIAPAVFLSAANIELLGVDPLVDTPTLTIKGLGYKVWQRQPDGLGGVRLLLHRTGV